MTSTVCIKRTNYDTLYENLAEIVMSCGRMDVGSYSKMIIKINLCDFRLPETGVVTHPAFLDSLLNYIRDDLGDIDVYVVESDASRSRPDNIFRWLGFQRILERWGAVYLNLSKTSTIRKGIEGFYFKEMDVPQVFDGSYFISLAKMKTHSDVKLSCALKNQFGCLPYPRKVRFHPHLDEVIVDCNLAMRPDFCIVDGIIAHGGVYGPTEGIPIHAGVVVAGKDPVSVDAVCSTIMRVRPSSVRYLNMAAKIGVGSLKYELAGDPIQAIDADFEIGLRERILADGAERATQVVKALGSLRRPKRR